jgi:hypothetical protein
MDKLLEMKPQETTHDIDGASLHLATSASAPHLLAQNFKPHATQTSGEIIHL